MIVVFPVHTHLLFCNYLASEESAGCFIVIVLLQSYHFLCSVSIPLGAMSCYVACDCGMSWL